MKHTAVLLVLCVFALGAVALADEIRAARDSAPVSLEVEPWLFVSLAEGGVDGQNGHDDGNEGFYLDVEPGENGAWDVEEMEVRHNCHAFVSGVLTPPPGAPGAWSWDFIFEDGRHGHGVHLEPPHKGWGWGHLKLLVEVRVDGITINDPAGVYAGGQMTVYAVCDDHDHDD